MESKEQIMNIYAKERGYESFKDLIEDEDSIIGNLVHIDAHYSITLLEVY